jgi:hypothetical protein
VCMRQKNAPVWARASQRVTDGTALGVTEAWPLELPVPPVGMTRRSVSSSHQAAYPVVGGRKMREKAEKSRLFRVDGIVCFLLPLHSSGRGYARCMDEHEERSEAEAPWPERPRLTPYAQERLWREVWAWLLSPLPDERSEAEPGTRGSGPPAR